MTTTGDMIVGGTSGTPTRLPLPTGNNLQMLVASPGTSPQYTSLLTQKGALAVGAVGSSWAQLNPAADGTVLSLVSGTPAWVVPTSQAAVLSVYLSADKAVPATTYTNIVFDTVYLNSLGGGSFSAATGILTVPVAGMYRITAHAAFASPNSSVQAMHNGTQVTFSPGAAVNPAYGLYMARPPLSGLAPWATPCTPTFIPLRRTRSKASLP